MGQETHFWQMGKLRPGMAQPKSCRELVAEAGGEPGSPEPASLTLAPQQEAPPNLWLLFQRER